MKIKLIILTALLMGFWAIYNNYRLKNLTQVDPETAQDSLDKRTSEPSDKEPRTEEKLQDTQVLASPEKEMNEDQETEGIKGPPREPEGRRNRDDDQDSDQEVFQELDKVEPGLAQEMKDDLQQIEEDVDELESEDDDIERGDSEYRPLNEQEKQSEF